MFKKWLQRVLGIEDIKELIYKQNNNILAHDRSSEKLMREYEKDNIKLSQMLENAKTVLIAKEEQIELQNNMILEKDSEIQRLTKIIEENNKFQEKVEQHLETVATIAKNVHKSRLEKKMNAVAYTRNNMTDEAKAKLK